MNVRDLLTDPAALTSALVVGVFCTLIAAAISWFVLRSFKWAGRRFNQAFENGLRHEELMVANPGLLTLEAIRCTLGMVFVFGLTFSMYHAQSIVANAPPAVQDITLLLILIAAILNFYIGARVGWLMGMVGDARKTYIDQCKSRGTQ